MLIQKPLGWLQRFLYNVEQGPLPSPTPVIDVRFDWPLDYSRISVLDVTIAGTLNTTVYAPGPEKHGLVWTLNKYKSAAGTFPATDVHGLNLTLREGEIVRVWTLEDTLGGAGIDHIPFIGSKSTFKQYSPGSSQIHGLHPVYVPPGASLQIVHLSVAGGDAFSILGVVVERPKSYPLALPT